MFNESVIQPLIDRLGWSEFENETYVIKLNEGNKKKDSGLVLNSFHGMVTLQGIHECMPIDNPSDVEFNNFLNEILDNTIREILTDVYVTDERSKNIDYTEAIANSTASGVFDNCIGYCHAVKVLQVLVSSLQSNRTERRNKNTYSELSIELKGLTDMRGVLVSKGLIHHCMEQRNYLKLKAFEISDIVIEDGTNHW